MRRREEVKQPPLHHPENLLEPERKYRLRRYSLGFIAFSCLSAAIPNAAVEEVTQVPALVRRAMASECGTPSASSIQTADNLLSGEPSPTRVRVGREIIGTTIAINDFRQQQERQAVGQELGLAMHDGTPYIRELGLAPDMPTAEVVETIMPFLNQYGIDTVELANSSDFQSESWTTIEAGDYQYERNISLMSLVKTLSSLPEEYVRDSGITRIAFGRYIQKQSATGELEPPVMAYVTESNQETLATHTITVNTSQVSEPDNFSHELFHKIDVKICGNQIAAQNDPGFGALLHSDMPQSVPYTVHEYQSLATNISQKIAWYDPLCKKQVAVAEQQLNQLAQNTLYASEYGREGGIREAKAELFESQADEIGPRLVPIRKQLAFLIARLYERDSRVGTFMGTFFQDRFTVPANETGGAHDVTTESCRQ